MKGNFPQTLAVKFPCVGAGGCKYISLSLSPSVSHSVTAETIDVCKPTQFAHSHQSAPPIHTYSALGFPFHVPASRHKRELDAQHFKWQHKLRVILPETKKFPSVCSSSSQDSRGHRAQNRWLMPEKRRDWTSPNILRQTDRQTVFNRSTAHLTN